MDLLTCSPLPNRCACRLFTALSVVALTVCVPACGGGDGPSIAAGPEAEGIFWWPYAQTAWCNTHHDPSLSDYTRYDPADRFEASVVRFEEITGDALFTGMSFDDANDRVYVTTGQAEQPNLFAFNMAGKLQWTSDGWDPSNWDPGARLGSGATSGTAIVDVDGNIYLCDAERAWSSTRDGRLRWLAPLPVEESDGKSYPFITPFFTRTGQVGGVTAAGRVVILDRATGTSVPGNEGGLLLPGLVEVQDETEFSVPGFLMSRLLWNTCDPENPYMMDPTLIAALGQAFLGRAAPWPTPRRSCPTRTTRRARGSMSQHGSRRKARRALFRSGSSAWT
ncbi:MAG: hypothetical protein AB1640_23560 [bacterium]